jgi:hypothetical protein
MNEECTNYWQKVIGDKNIKIELQTLRKVVESFETKPDNSKQKLVYLLLEAIRNNDQKEFFYILLKAINQPKENFSKLWEQLKNCYDIMPEEAFINFGYTIVIGIMATYKGKNE